MMDMFYALVVMLYSGDKSGLTFMGNFETSAQCEIAATAMKDEFRARTGPGYRWKMEPFCILEVMEK